MSKYLNVSTGNYTIKVQPGGLIDLDTGLDGQTPGKVIIRGDLEVQGDTTSVSTTELNFEDNIILLNRPEAGASNTFDGVQRDNGTAGIGIARGDLVDTFWLFDENIAWRVPGTGTERRGGWAPRDANGDVLGVELTSITTPGGGDLNLLGRYSTGTSSSAANPGFVTVRGTNVAPGTGNTYAESIIGLVPDISQPGTIIDDIIPNVAYVNTAINQQLSASFQDTIQEGTFGPSPTRVEVQDDTVTSNPSKALIAINDITRAEFFDQEAQLYNIQISGTGADPAVIESKSTGGNQNLVLRAEGIGRVVVQDDLVLTRTPHQGGFVDPNQPDNGVSLYNQAESTGGTGTYFVNEEGTRDELISNNRALVYSMLF